METALTVLNQILMLFIIAAIGFALRKTKVFTDQVIKGINTLVLNVTWPAMSIMITQKQYTSESLKGFLIVLLAATAFMAASFAFGSLIFKKIPDRNRRSALVCLSALPNAGFMGLPIVDAVYGDTGVLYLAAFVSGFNIVVWTLGTMLFEGFNLKGAIKGLMSAGFIGMLVGITLFLLKVDLPDILGNCVDQIGAFNTPLSMLLLGARMDGLDLKKLSGFSFWIACFVKLFVLPIILLGILYLAGLRDILLVLPVLLMAMPSASACQMLCERYDADAAFAASGVAVCTLLCAISVPVVMMIASLL